MEIPVSTEKKTKIGLVDDHSLFRQGLAKALTTSPDLEISIMAGNGLELIEALQRSEAPDLVILDITMPEMDGHRTAEWLNLNKPNIRVLILSMHDANHLLPVMPKGVRGLLTKDSSEAELLKAVHDIINKGVYCSEKVTGRLFNQMRDFGKKDSEWTKMVLNEREIAFLALVATELTYKEIADNMCISPRTVDNYRDALFAKLKVSSRVGLATYALKTGIANFL